MCHFSYIINLCLFFVFIPHFLFATPSDSECEMCGLPEGALHAFHILPDHLNFETRLLKEEHGSLPTKMSLPEIIHYAERYLRVRDVLQEKYDRYYSTLTKDAYAEVISVGKTCILNEEDFKIISYHKKFSVNGKDRPHPSYFIPQDLLIGPLANNEREKIKRVFIDKSQSWLPIIDAYRKIDTYRKTKDYKKLETTLPFPKRLEAIEHFYLTHVLQPFMAKMIRQEFSFDDFRHSVGFYYWLTFSDQKLKNTSDINTSKTLFKNFFRRYLDIYSQEARREEIVEYNKQHDWMHGLALTLLMVTDDSDLKEKVFSIFFEDASYNRFLISYWFPRDIDFTFQQFLWLMKNHLNASQKKTLRSLLANYYKFESFSSFQMFLALCEDNEKLGFQKCVWERNPFSFEVIR